MVKRLLITLFSTLLLLSCGGNREDSIYCNPLDLDYGWGIFKKDLPLCRTSADPVIVFFKDKYYLFSTHDIGGYRVSRDMVRWKNMKFNKEVWNSAYNAGGTYVAPAVAHDGEYVYFIKINNDKSAKTVDIIRSPDPSKGGWKVCGTIKKVADPSLLIDGGRYFVYYGLGNGIRRFELDPKDFSMIEGSEETILPKVRDVNDCDGGYEFGRREIFDEIQAPEWKGRYKMTPCEEGAWITRVGDKYYLQYATPGTICIWYCDAVMTAPSPEGPFTLEPYNPVSLKAGGFIGSAGHSGVFADRYGNWWEITTMWVGNSNEFERRLGLFPVTFSPEGKMTVHTTLGDWPMVLPHRKFDASEGNLKGWWCLSYGKDCTASSSKEGFGPEKASDEDIRTWWAAEEGKGAWLSMDLGYVKDVNAIQLNFAEQNFTPDTFEEDYTAYRLYTSVDGKTWKKAVDRSRARKTNPHPFHVLKNTVQARYIKVECVHPMNGQSFAVRDMRVFGSGKGPVPGEVTDLRVERDLQDGRYASLKWTPVPDADGYIVRFGVDPDDLNLTIQVKGWMNSSLLVHILTRGQRYYYAIDTYNDCGVTPGAVIWESNNNQ